MGIYILQAQANYGNIQVTGRILTVPIIIWEVIKDIAPIFIHHGVPQGNSVLISMRMVCMPCLNQIWQNEYPGKESRRGIESEEQPGGGQGQEDVGGGGQGGR